MKTATVIHVTTGILLRFNDGTTLTVYGEDSRRGSTEGPGVSQFRKLQTGQLEAVQFNAIESSATFYVPAKNADPYAIPTLSRKGRKSVLAILHSLKIMTPRQLELVAWQLTQGQQVRLPKMLSDSRVGAIIFKLKEHGFFRPNPEVGWPEACRMFTRFDHDHLRTKGNATCTGKATYPAKWEGIISSIVEGKKKTRQ